MRKMTDDVVDRAMEILSCCANDRELLFGRRTPRMKLSTFMFADDPKAENLAAVALASAQYEIARERWSYTLTQTDWRACCYALAEAKLGSGWRP